MRYVATCTVPVGAKDWGDAVGAFVRRVRALADSGQTPRIELMLNGSVAPVRVLAEALGETGQFGPATVSAPAWTGRAFLAQARGLRRAQCRVTLDSPLDLAARLALLERLAEELPPASRTSQLFVQASPLAVGAATGTLQLAASGGRITSFLRVGFEAAEPSGPVLAAARGVVLAALGATLERPHPVLERNPSSADELSRWVSVVAAYEEALARAAEQLKLGGVALDGVAGLMSDDVAWSERMDAVGSGRGVGRIALAPALKRCIRHHLPGWSFDGLDGELLVFRKLLGPALDALIAFERSGRLGKTFAVHVGADFPGSPLAGARLNRSLFGLWGQEELPPVWVYSDPEALETALVGCAGLLARVLPVLETNLLALLSPLPELVPECVPVRKPLTAREALGLAVGVARENIGEPELYLASCSARPPLSEDLAPILEGGRAALHCLWTFSFLRRETGALCHVKVPRVGRLRQTTIRGSDSGPALPTIDPDDWIDSPGWHAAVLRWAESHAPGASPSMFYAQLAGGHSGPRWKVGLRLLGQRHDLEVGKEGVITGS